MKKVLLIMMAALSILFTQCKKTEIIPSTPAAEGGVSITLKVGGNSKVNVNPETGAVTFQRDDKIYVANGGKYVGTLTHNGTQFTGTIIGAEETDEPLYFYFLGNKMPSGTLSAGTTSSLTVDLSDQTDALPVISCAPSNENYSPSTTNYTATLHNKCALVRFTLNQEVTSGYVAVKKMNNVVEVDLTDAGTFTPSKGNEMTKIFREDNTHFYMIALEQNEIVSVDGDVICENGRKGNFGTLPAVVPGMYMSKDVTFAPEGLCFTANAAGTISMKNLETGTALNLQYSTDNGATWTVWSDLTTPINVEEGDKFYVKAGESVNTSIYPYIFQTTGDFKVSGNIMYLLDKNLSPETTMKERCFFGLFINMPTGGYNNSITDASELQLSGATRNMCYYMMFYGCTGLTSAPALPATTLAGYCYNSMFNGCTSLTEAPELPAETLAVSCYLRMFQGCTSLTEAPELPAETLADGCYYEMFDGCTSLVAAPALPAIELAVDCYCNMFNNCTSLESAPALPATTLANGCYTMMFSGCSNLSSVTMLATDVSANVCLTDWLKDAGTGGNKVIINKDASDETEAIIRSNSAGWDVVRLGSGPEGLCFTANAAGTISMMNSGTTGTAPNLQYSTDNGATWAVWSDVTAEINVGEGDKVYIKAGVSGNTSVYPYVFKTTGGFKVSGNIMCLLDNDLTPEPVVSTDCFKKMFSNSYPLRNAITDASGLQLPETTANSCYNNMFRDCASLTAAPALPAETLADGCYGYMFAYCNGLTAAPALPATTLALECYKSMFESCSKLTTAPILPATTLAQGCYANMFWGCSKLTVAPELPATTLTPNCYNCMFNYCGNLASVTMLATDASASGCLSNWLNNAGTSATNPTVHVASGMKTAVEGTLNTNVWSVVENSK